MANWDDVDSVLGMSGGIRAVRWLTPLGTWDYSIAYLERNRRWYGPANLWCACSTSSGAEINSHVLRYDAGLLAHRRASWFLHSISHNPVSGLPGIYGMDGGRPGAQYPSLTLLRPLYR
jgi:hypothetical protein